MWHCRTDRHACLAKSPFKGWKKKKTIRHVKILYNTKTLILKCCLWGFFHFNEAWKSAFKNEARVLCFLLQNEAYVIKEMCLQIKFYWVRICTALHRQSWITERGKLCKYKIFPTGLLREKFAGLQFNYTCLGQNYQCLGLSLHLLVSWDLVSV